VLSKTLARFSAVGEIFSSCRRDFQQLARFSAVGEIFSSWRDFQQLAQLLKIHCGKSSLGGC
jgi:hypothetical protein